MKVGLFPGQGIEAKEVLASLDPEHPHVATSSEILGFDLIRAIRQVCGRSTGILPTKLAQPAIFIAGVISYDKAVESGESFDFLLGHSLGEYTALTAAGSIPFGQGLKLIAARAEVMHRAALHASGGMAAVLGLELDSVEEIAAEHQLQVANDNSPKQVVLAGDLARLARAAEAVRSKGGRSILLNVEGAFHSNAMEPAVDELHHALTFVDVRNPLVPVISNVSARPYRAPGEIRRLLDDQLTRRVRFRESLH